MKHRRSSAWSVPYLALVLATATGCARDGSFEPRGSIKDSPPTAASTYQTRVPVRRSAERPLIDRVAVPAPSPETEQRQAAPAMPTPPPITTSAPQAIPPAPQTPPAVQTVRRPPSNGPHLLEEGRMLFRSGEVLAARERYVAALNAPLPEVLLELARTYDPNYLERLSKTDASADADRARALYEQAATLGSKSAEADLARLLGGAAASPTSR